MIVWRINICTCAMINRWVGKVNFRLPLQWSLIISFARNSTFLFFYSFFSTVSTLSRFKSGRRHFHSFPPIFRGFFILLSALSRVDARRTSYRRNPVHLCTGVSRQNWLVRPAVPVCFYSGRNSVEVRPVLLEKFPRFRRQNRFLPLQRFSVLCLRSKNHSAPDPNRKPGSRPLKFLHIVPRDWMLFFLPLSLTIQPDWGLSALLEIVFHARTLLQIFERGWNTWICSCMCFLGVEKYIPVGCSIFVVVLLLDVLLEIRICVYYRRNVIYLMMVIFTKNFTRGLLSKCK